MTTGITWDEITRETGSAPRVTVGMPVYNGERFLPIALDSVLRQTYSDFEIVISDNCSTDSTADICNAYAAQDKRIRYVRQSRNIGPIPNFVSLTRRARGEYFTWLAHDDVLEPRFLEATVKHLDNHPKAVIAAGDFSIIDQDGKEVRQEALVDVRADLPWSIRQIQFYEFAYPNTHLCIYGLMRAALCQQVMATVRTPKMLTGSEYPILAKFAAAGEIASIAEPLRGYRIVETGAFNTEVTAQAKMSAFRRNIAFYSNLFDIRLSLFMTLMRSPESLAFKAKVLRRHMAMDYNWYRFNLGGRWYDRPKLFEDEKAEGEASKEVSVV